MERPRDVESKEREPKRRIIVGISGASFPILGIRTVEVLSQMPDIEVHLVVTEGAKEVMRAELGWTDEEIDKHLLQKADVTYSERNMAASISSGSFKTIGMIVVPCSVKTLSHIAYANDENLLTRAAFCTLKENNRTLVLVPRETPATLDYLNNLVKAKQNGAVIFFPEPASYHGPETVDDIVNHMVGRILDQVGIEANLFRRWEGPIKS